MPQGTRITRTHASDHEPEGTVTEIATIEPSDFFKEAVEDFIQSAGDEKIYANCIIKTAISAELLIQESLFRICPSLILDRIDDSGLQVAMAHQFEDRVTKKELLRDRAIRTAPFLTLVKRADVFIGIAQHLQHLKDLYEWRNALVHHRADLEAERVQYVLAKYVFPFLKDLAYRIDSNADVGDEGIWRTIEQIALKTTTPALAHLKVKIQKYVMIASKIPRHDVEGRLASKIHTDSDESINEDDVSCPACQNDALAVIDLISIDGGPDGVEFGYGGRIARCRVCGLSLERDELEDIAYNVDQFDHGEALEGAIHRANQIPPDPEDYMSDYT